MERKNVLLWKMRLEGGLGLEGDKPWIPCRRVWILGNGKPWRIYEKGSGVIWSSDVIQKVLQELIMTSGSQLWTWVLRGWLIEEEGESQMADLTRGGFWSHSLGQGQGSLRQQHPCGHAFYKLYHCEVVRTGTVTPILDEELARKCFAQGHGVGQQPVWDCQQDLIRLPQAHSHARWCFS